MSWKQRTASTLIGLGRKVEDQDRRIKDLEHFKREREIEALPEFDRLLARYEQAKEEHGKYGLYPGSWKRLQAAKKALQEYCERQGCVNPVEADETA